MTRSRIVTAQPAELAVGGDGQDCLDREVGVVRQVTHEVVGTKLVLGVPAVFFKVRFPLSQLRPPSGEKSALPSILAMVAQSKIIFALSSTGIRSASFRESSPPP